MASHVLPAQRATSSLHRATSSTPGYFEYNPSLQSDNAAIARSMAQTRISSPPTTTLDMSKRNSNNTVRLDAFHVRASQDFDLPENTSIYAKRALPALPPIKTTIRKVPSSAEIRTPSSAISFSYPRRPSLYTQGRTVTADCCDHPTQSLPASASPERAVAGHQRISSYDSVASSKSPSTYEADHVPIRRPRQMRSTSFRNFFNRNTFPSTSIETSQRSASSLSHSSELSIADSCVDSVLDDPGLSMSKSGTPTSTAPSSRRPSTLSLTSLRPRKVSSETVPSSTAARQPVLKKNSNAAPVRRWNIFAGPGNDRHGDEDEVACPSTSSSSSSPGTASSSTPVSELSCVRCYYFSARNCNGWIMGGSHGEACDTCTMHGFFGSP